MDKFDFSWFMTIPGALISAGVVCLLIAIIVLIISNVRDGKEKKALAAVDVEPTPADANNVVSVPQGSADVNNQVAAVPVAAAPVAVEQTPVVPVSVPPVEVAAPVETVPPQVDVMPVATDMVQAPVASVEVAPIAQAVEMPVTVETPLTGVQPVEVAPVAVAVPVTEELVPENVTVEMPITVEAPIVEAPTTLDVPVTVEMPVTIEAPVVEAQPVEVMQQAETLENQVPVVENQPVEIAQPQVELMQQAEVQTVSEVQPVIYGGASLGVSNLDLNQNPTHQIYGGANPLENTQSMPIMGDFNQNQMAPVEVVQPTMESAPAAPVEMMQPVEVVSSVPVMEPIA